MNQEKVENIIKTTTEENQKDIDWTKAWSGKYPILASYQEKVDIIKYKLKIREIISSLKNEYGYNDLDSFLVLKDIMYQEWKDKKSLKK